MESSTRKRSRSRSPPPWYRQSKSPRKEHSRADTRRQEDGYRRRGQDSFAQEQSRRNEANQEAEMREWVSKEDEFVLKQSKKKALIRVREGRAKPIDWLAVILSVMDPARDILEEDSVDAGIDIMDPEGVLDALGISGLDDVEKETEQYVTLETNKENLTYWKAISVICKDRRHRLQPSGPSGRGVSAVTTDIDKILAPKTLDQLTTLEGQVNTKLQSNEPIDEDYWEQLLSSISVYKAKAQLRNIYTSIVESRLKEFCAQQVEEARTAKSTLSNLATSSSNGNSIDSQDLDPVPQLKVLAEDRGLRIIEEKDFLDSINEERKKVRRLGFIPRKLGSMETMSPSSNRKTESEILNHPDSRPATISAEDYSQATKALYDREVAKGVQEDEEIFTGEEEVASAAKAPIVGNYRPRKPRYFNRVQMGYEWNKYNQTHYDHDNPPPKVVQGYKFNVFYPDLIDKSKAPKYRIERENGRKRGQTLAPAGQEDTCLIRFMSGPPYEDLAFRIVDKEWDYSAKHERGFKSSFDKGILQLHFQFKKVYYRK